MIAGRTYVPRQGNNSYIFPGVGLGAILSRTTRITDEMFMAAAQALAHTVSAADLEQGSLYPPLKSVREVSAKIAATVIEVALEQGYARIARPADLLGAVRRAMYEPAYEQYILE